ncbi:hypothetical protein ACLI1A_01565 [Flavobacterium sp. RHBU_3]|uniref:hypothetical protein n=1 Tax=Flavobacterium sp. RHBU_3 TaxID=3391184 RepID=UPI003985258E
MLLFWIDKSRPSKSPGEDDEIDYSHYSYRHEGTKVRKAIAYFVWNDSVNVEKAENIQNEITFNYDKLGRVIRQDITVGKAGEDMPLTIFGTQTGYCEDTHIDYAYDTKNRITKIVLMSCEKVVFEERYFYATDKDYVASVFTFSPGFNSKFKSTWTTYYNEHGDITSCFLSTSPEDPHKVPPLGITGYGFTHRYYDYEYDSYGNWIKCRFFLEGTHEGEPSAIVERKIEYYKE